jgi:ElaB/YqjD/DUF883 family membrane-anchored ribosome-binding protein
MSPTLAGDFFPLCSNMNMTETREKWSAFQQRATETARNACKSTDEYIRENTWISLAVALGIGLAVGFLINGSRRRAEAEE